MMMIWMDRIVIKVVHRRCADFLAIVGCRPYWFEVYMSCYTGTVQYALLSRPLLLAAEMKEQDEEGKRRIKKHTYISPPPVKLLHTTYAYVLCTAKSTQDRNLLLAFCYCTL